MLGCLTQTHMLNNAKFLHQASIATRTTIAFKLAIAISGKVVTMATNQTKLNLVKNQDHRHQIRQTAPPVLPPPPQPLIMGANLTSQMNLNVDSPSARPVPPHQLIRRQSRAISIPLRCQVKSRQIRAPKV